MKIADIELLFKSSKDLQESTKISLLMDILTRYVQNPSYSNKENIINAWDSLIKEFPNKEATLYRGLNFSNSKDYKSFVDKLPIYSTESITSWSDNYHEALVFAKVSPQAIEQMTPEKWNELSKQKEKGEKVNGYGGVVLSYHAPYGVGIDLGKAGVSLENEVILPTALYKVDHEEILSYENELYGKDINSIIEDITDEKKIEYIIKNKNEELTDSSFSLIFNKIWIDPEYKVVKDYSVVTESYNISLKLKYNPFIISNLTLFPTSIQDYVKDEFKSLMNDIQEEVEKIKNETDDSYDLYGFNILQNISRKL